MERKLNRFYIQKLKTQIKAQVNKIKSARASARELQGMERWHAQAEAQKLGRRCRVLLTAYQILRGVHVALIESPNTNPYTVPTPKEVSEVVRDLIPDPGTRGAESSRAARVVDEWVEALKAGTAEALRQRELDELKLYFAVRRDLSEGRRAAQLIHAMNLWSERYGPHKGAVIVYGVDGEEGVLDAARGCDGRSVTWREPDLGGQATAVAMKSGRLALPLL